MHLPVERESMDTDQWIFTNGSVPQTSMCSILPLVREKSPWVLDIVHEPVHVAL